MSTEMILLILVVLAGAYMAWNIGANDVANAMGTSVGSGALTLKQAVCIAAVLEFSGAFFFGSHVSETIQKGIVDSAIFEPDPLVLVYGMLSALIAAGAWLQLASYYGWPVSTTHSIVGAVIGFGAVVGGVEAIYWDNVAFIVTSWVLSPLFGGIISYGIFTLLRRHIFYTSNPVESAKKITPYLVFSVIAILSQVMLFKGLSNVALQFNFIEALGVSFLSGSIGFLISLLLLRRIRPLTHMIKSKTEQDTELYSELEKAKQHLVLIQKTSLGATQYQANEILEEMQNLSESLKQKEIIGNESAEYAVVEKIFAYLQIISACMMAFAHGANDVANAIGPLAAAVGILTTGYISAQTTVPTWTLALGGVGIVIGLATWGWRVIETIGKKITELTPTRGFSAEFGAAATILIASRLGLPISTTHTLVGAVIGVGLARGIEALDLRTTRHIVISWIVTVPAGAIITIILFFIIRSIFA
ncbi:MAG: inorganic phosphate transporter [Parachlamydiaceae bacterium]|nr:inorganic phosphate transporter [Parachlamydiaceae bacterium]